MLGAGTGVGAGVGAGVGGAVGAGVGGAAHQREDRSEEGEVAAARARRVRDEHDVAVDDERSRRPRRVQLTGEVEG